LVLLLQTFVEAKESVNVAGIEFDALSIMMNTQIRLIDILICGTQVEVAFCTLWLYLEGLDVCVNRFLIVGLNVISIT
jgi:hypothetical protein